MYASLLLCLTSVSEFCSQALPGVFARKEFLASGSMCGSSLFATELDVRVQLSFLLSARASCKMHQGCVHLHGWQEHDCDRVAGSSTLCVSACGKRIALPSIRISSKSSVSFLSNPDVRTSCLQKRSVDKHALCVFTGEKP